ncbi:hypothetical protein [Ulvibacter litoralis]|uniref:Uncharacterized protein n=1 Tax=Ulvibacter litoralis TaxID=227084 RepID=A0A1G7FKK1_9FLAO|nr:hypothetical protein [Ulvibacter litoralis]GHC50756.1 hypothetical protein GCM10008083_12940 [Ulvibacter litoralis]SDE76423.1 hypothetical protein SAMN05421855_102614 [Ulvibacter litoralis]
MRFISNRVRGFLSIIIVLVAVKSTAQELIENIQDQVVYNSFMDADNLYVQLSTHDKPTMLSMLLRGFYVYFDVKGKKKKKVSVLYPSEVTAVPKKSGTRNGIDERLQEEDHKGPDILTLVAEMPKKANYTNLDFEEEFHLDLNSLGISIHYTLENDQLHYKLKMPKQLISNKAIDFSKFSIGVVTPKMESKERENKPSMTAGGGQRGSSGGGQRGGGRGSGGKGGQGSRPDTSSQQDERPKEIMLDIWFEPNVLKK